MHTILIQPGQQPHLVQPDTPHAVYASKGILLDPLWIAELLGCAPKLVDILASGDNYAIYTIFDCEDDINVRGTELAAELTGADFDFAADDEALRGPVVIVTV